jgi:monothiol glutaredoxin
MRPELKQKIDSLIKDNSIVLFMKGTKDWPECGFSKRVVDVLESLNVDFLDVNILEDPELREGIKVYSSWPTIPQLYIKGEFIGGCDIALDMYQKGSLRALCQ